MNRRAGHAALLLTPSQLPPKSAARCRLKMKDGEFAVFYAVAQAAKRPAIEERPGLTDASAAHRMDPSAGHFRMVQRAHETANPTNCFPHSSGRSSVLYAENCSCTPRPGKRLFIFRFWPVDAAPPPRKRRSCTALVPDRAGHLIRNPNSTLGAKDEVELVGRPLRKLGVPLKTPSAPSAYWWCSINSK